MRKITIAALVSGVLLISSCSKSPSGNAGGSWILNQLTYLTTTCVASTTSNTLYATGSTTTNTSGGSLTFNFTTLPATGNTYVVAPNGYPINSSQIGITATVNGSTITNYESTGGGGNENVSVTISGGKITVAYNGTIQMRNTTNANDSVALNDLYVTQTN